MRLIPLPVVGLLHPSFRLRHAGRYRDKILSGSYRHPDGYRISSIRIFAVFSIRDFRHYTGRNGRLVSALCRVLCSPLFPADRATSGSSALPCGLHGNHPFFFRSHQDQDLFLQAHRSFTVSTTFGNVFCIQILMDFSFYFLKALSSVFVHNFIQFSFKRSLRNAGVSSGCGNDQEQNKRAYEPVEISYNFLSDIWQKIKAVQALQEDF